MKNLKVITIVTALLMAMPAASLLAQRKASKTSSGRAAYGYPSESKSKKKKKNKQKQKSKARKAKTKQPLNRNKTGWAG